MLHDSQLMSKQQLRTEFQHEDLITVNNGVQAVGNS
jgi:hypothetical protein